MSTKAIKLTDADGNTLLPENAESGPNYIKFADGTFFQFFAVTGVALNNEALKYMEVNFPYAFASKPSMVFASSTATEVANYLFRVGASAVDATKFRLSIGTWNNQPITASNRSFMVLAIGRWK